MEIRNVLLVDDDPDIRRIGQLSLKAVGKFEVTLARSGAEAVELALQKRPDVILLDMMMPNMDGPSTLSALKQHPSLFAVPVIFMTARANNQDVDLFLDLGAIGVIAKPFDPMAISNQVCKLVAEQLQLVAC